MMAASVYAVLVADVGMMKVGFATQPRYVHSASSNARRRFGSTSPGTPIWLRPGELRDELFIQAHLAYLFPQPEAWDRRASEWFIVGDQSPSQLAAVLDDIHGKIPVTDVPPAERRVAELDPEIAAQWAAPPSGRPGAAQGSSGSASRPGAVDG
jgi:hypothetical protein